MPAADDLSDVCSEDSDDEEQRGLKGLHGYVPGQGDGRTISQIKRSRIDLNKRYVFLCPTALNKHFDTLPHQAKDGALLVFRCSRNWLFSDPAEVRNARTKARIDVGPRRSILSPEKAFALSSALSRSPSWNSLGVALYRTDFSRDFLRWVLTKEKEGCVFWYKPAKDLEMLSDFFEDKQDPVREQPYKPLILDPQWWRCKFQRTGARFCKNPTGIVMAINEFYRGDTQDRREQAIDVHALQELIYQSNPTLEPIEKWPHAPSMRFLPRGQKMSADNVQQETNFRGYIDNSLGPQASQQSSPARHRVTKWPATSPRDRYDDLHTKWQDEESSFTRRQILAMHGASMFGKHGSLSAR
mmetsp:Transcript_55645/g.143363  ORF Transcript_55645/g.143363 Transcript_55645/m.143363 type:complete len:356 (-) Transcript_55645:102-1169(-)